MRPQNEKLYRFRTAGMVRRCHTIPIQGEYSVATHSFNAACIIIALHPNPSKELIVAALTHDLAEQWVGDVPAPAKHFFKDLGKSFEVAESAVLARVLGIDLSRLSEQENIWLRVADLLELYLFTQEQMTFWGNTWVEPMHDAVRNALNLTQVPLEIDEFLSEFDLHPGWEKINDVWSGK